MDILDSIMDAYPWLRITIVYSNNWIMRSSINQLWTSIIGGFIRVWFSYSTNLLMPRIYCCLSISYWFSYILLLSSYKTIAFHNTTKGVCLSGRTVIIILLMYNQILYDNKQPLQTPCFEARRKCGVGFIHTQLASSYANAPQKLASSPSTVGFITRDFQPLISLRHSQTNIWGLYTQFLTPKTPCMQKKSAL